MNESEDKYFLPLKIYNMVNYEVDGVEKAKDLLTKLLKSLVDLLEDALQEEIAVSDEDLSDAVEQCINGMIDIDRQRKRIN